MVRRILSGRKDREKRTPGLIQDCILIEVDTFVSLTFFGLLFAIKHCKFTGKQLLRIAKNHEEMLPLSLVKMMFYLGIKLV